jgi:hypothetical protein
LSDFAEAFTIRRFHARIAIALGAMSNEEQLWNGR